MLRDVGAKRGTKGGPEALNRHQCALTDIDASGAVEYPGNESGYRDALQAGGDTVEGLNGEDAPALDHRCRDEPTDR